MASVALQLMLTSSFVEADQTVSLPQKETQLLGKAARCSPAAAVNLDGAPWPVGGRGLLSCGHPPP